MSALSTVLSRPEDPEWAHSRLPTCPSPDGSRPGWFEVEFILSDNGFGCALFIEDGEGADPTLLSACPSIGPAT